jgi:hypothetical protein
MEVLARQMMSFRQHSQKRNRDFLALATGRRGHHKGVYFSLWQFKKVAKVHASFLHDDVCMTQWLKRRAQKP